jgi:hypothetical protein
MAGDWRIEYRRSGGFAGVTRTTILDAETLGPEAAHDVERLLDGLDLDALAARPQPRRGADRFQHDVMVERGGRRRSFTVFDGDVPPEVQRLLERLHATGSS